MTTYVAFDRSQPFLLPPDLKDWLPEDDFAHFVVAAVERVRLGVFGVNAQAGGKPQYHPRLMLALLIYSYANGIFSSRRIERASYRDIGVRFVAANTHPDRDTIATFRRANKAAFEAAFLEVLLLARASGLLRLGTVSIDGTKIDANASKIRSVRYDRAQRLRTKLAADIAEFDRQSGGSRWRGRGPAGAAGADRPARGAEREARCRLRAPGGGSQGRGRRRTPAVREEQGGL
jgi:transposase